jgi:hypothetical protein
LTPEAKSRIISKVHFPLMILAVRATGQIELAWEDDIVVVRSIDGYSSYAKDDHINKVLCIFE